MDEGNNVAENGVEGGIGYVEKNNLGTVTTKQLLPLEDMEPFQAIEKRIVFWSFKSLFVKNIINSLWNP